MMDLPEHYTTKPFLTLYRLLEGSARQALQTDERADGRGHVGLVGWEGWVA